MKRISNLNFINSDSPNPYIWKTKTDDLQNKCLKKKILVLIFNLAFNIGIFRVLPELEKPGEWISAVGLSTFGIIKSSMRSTVWVVRLSGWSTRAEKNVTESYVWLNCSLVRYCIL